MNTFRIALLGSEVAVSLVVGMKNTLIVQSVSSKIGVSTFALQSIGITEILTQLKFTRLML